MGIEPNPNRTHREPNTPNSNPVSCQTEPEPQMASKRTEPNKPTLLEPNRT